MDSIIIVPYRDRQAHLAQFLSHMAIHSPAMPICIVEQSEYKPFNRAKLLNIGFLENPKYTHYIFHDIDMLPIDVNYLIKYTIPIVQLARSDIQLFGYLGGVTRFTRAAFERSGGYNNEYFHRAEDNEMRFNLYRVDMNVINKPGKYRMLDHKREGPEFDPALWHKAQQPRLVQNQLTPQACLYVVQQTKEIGNVKHITVAI